MKKITAHEEHKIARNQSLYDFWQKEIDKGSMRTAAVEAARVKFGLYSVKAVYNILQKERERRGL